MLKQIEKEKRIKEENMPKFIAKTRLFYGAGGNLKIEITNISNNLSTDIKLSDIKVLSPDGSDFWKSTNSHTRQSLQGNETIEIELGNPPLSESGFTFVISMQCKDKYDDMHHYIIKSVYNGKRFSNS